MAKALDYVDSYLADSPVPEEAITRAADAHQEFVAALESLQAEEGDVLTKRNEADRARAQAHREFHAGRQLVAAALMLSDSPQPLSELLPSLSDILRGDTLSPAADDDRADEDQPVEPVDARSSRGGAARRGLLALQIPRNAFRPLGKTLQIPRNAFRLLRSHRYSLQPPRPSQRVGPCALDEARPSEG